jgi:RNA polymerase sigma-70 factor (ECF subfamily)
MVDAELAALAAAGRAAWPRIAWPADEFAAELVRRRVSAGSAERAADLYLAWACARGDPAALAAFEERHGRELAAFATLARIPASLVDDVAQEARHRLLVGQPGMPPRIAQYAGRGDLRAWLKVAVARQAIDLVRRTRREVRDDAALEALAAPALDLETALTRARCHDELRAAFAAALAGLAQRERALLRYRYVDGLSEDEVARIYQAHRVSVARWVARARGHLLEETRRGLAARMGLTSGEVTSVIRAVRSQLGVSLRRALGESE